MTTSRAKAAGSAAERRVAGLLGGVRVGHLGGPVDVRLGEYLDVQVKALRTLPSLNEIGAMLDAMEVEHTPEAAQRLRAAAIIHRPGRGKRARSFIAFDLEEYAEWHGGRDGRS